ncbi:MAG: DUF4416 family protein [Armatimonadetes bacterium]|nr:DUF4416 family protein [Armatimonadota bacterium]
MAEIISLQKVKLVLGMMTSKLNLFEELSLELEKKFGKIDFKSRFIPFNFTDYYKKELGENIFRQFISFKNLIEPQELVKIKIFTIRLEEKYKMRGLRQINLDPGYLNAGKLVLASTKDNQHRIYLNKGIYAEVTLRFKNKTFQSWEWTYPDYQTKDYIEIFNSVREIHLKQIKIEELF